MTDFWDLHKVKDITERKQNSKRKMNKAKPDSLSMSNRIEQQNRKYNPGIVLFTNNWSLLECKQKQKIIDTEAEIEVNTPICTCKN